MAADYYEILGVSRDASKEDMKRAYRRLARKYHPDVNKEAGAEDRFKEVNRAYEVLSEPETRARYDQFGEAGVSGAAGASGFEYGDMGGFADIFETIFGGFGGAAAGGGSARRRTGPTRGDDLRLDLRLNFREAIFGGEKEIRIPHLESCQGCQGSGAKSGTGSRTCATCNGAGQVRRATRTPFGSFAQVSACPTCNGAGEVIEEKCEVCNGVGRKQETKKLKRKENRPLLRSYLPSFVIEIDNLQVSSKIIEFNEPGGLKEKCPVPWLSTYLVLIYTERY